LSELLERRENWLNEWKTRGTQKGEEIREGQRKSSKWFQRVGLSCRESGKSQMLLYTKKD